MEDEMDDPSFANPDMEQGTEPINDPTSMAALHPQLQRATARPMGATCGPPR